MGKILLVDNGSLKPAATIMLRQLAHRLGRLCSRPVCAVSLRHADKIDAMALQGRPALLLKSFIREQLMAGEKDFLLLPLFFSISESVEKLLAQQVADLEADFGPFQVTVGKVLYPLPDGEVQLAEIVYDNIQQTIQRYQLEAKNIVLVDHGSPSRKVSEVRNRLAKDVTFLLGSRCKISEAVLERRKGKKYDFNGPLLQHWLEEKALAGEKTVIVSLMFLLPGRHAGKAGDIETICQQAMNDNPGLKVYITAVVGEHPSLVSLLHSRLKE